MKPGTPLDRRGFDGYCKIARAASAPRTIEELNELVDMKRAILVGHIIALHRLRILRIWGWTESRPIRGGRMTRRYPLFHFSAGDDVPAPPDAYVKALKSLPTMGSNAVAFATIVRALRDGPVLVSELVELSGATHATVRRIIKELHRKKDGQKLIYRHAWERQDRGWGAPYEQWRIGNRPDAGRPAPRTEEERRAAWVGYRETRIARAANASVFQFAQRAA